jgi:hypothetical protein
MIDWYGAAWHGNGLSVPAGAWLTNDAANHRLALLAVAGAGGLSLRPIREVAAIVDPAR